MKLPRYAGILGMVLLPSTGLATTSLDKEVVKAVECFRDKGDRVTFGDIPGFGTLYEWQVFLPNYESYRVVYTAMDRKKVGLNDTLTIQWDGRDYFQQKLGGEELTQQKRELFYKNIKKLGKVCLQKK